MNSNNIITIKDMNSLRSVLGNKEISQEENINSYTRIFVNEYGVVSKIYVGNPEFSRKNIEIIKYLLDNRSLLSDRFIAKPISIIVYKEKTIGYTMPYVSGVTLQEYLSSSFVSRESRATALCSLGKALNSLPSNVHIGDLHAQNVIVQPCEEIRVIDVDGFYVEGLHRMTCPLDYLLEDEKEQLPAKYHTDNGEIIISSESDLLCYTLIILNYLLGNYNYLSLSKDDRVRYLRFINKRGLDKDIVLSIHSVLFSNRKNQWYDLLRLKQSLTEADIDSFSYSSFMNRSKWSISREQRAKRKLSQYINNY